MHYVEILQILKHQIKIPNLLNLKELQFSPYYTTIQIKIQGDYVTIEVYKNDKDFGKHNKILAEFFGVVDGQEITIDSRDFINKDKDKVEKKTVYRILVNGYETTVIIHTSDSKDLFVGDEHTTDPDTTGDADISLIVVSGTDENLNPTISDASNKSK